MDVDRIPSLADQADPDAEALADEQGWADLAARYDGLTAGQFIRLPAPERRAAVQARQAS